VAITMRTPGQGRELAVGFLFSEGITRSVEDLGGVTYCGRPGEEGWGNIIEVTPAPGLVLEVERVSAARRGTLTTAACGVCGRRSVEDLMPVCSLVAPGPVLAPEVVARATERLHEVQRNSARTGGVHAAAALDAVGEVLDKVVGALVLGWVVRSSRASVSGTAPAPRSSQRE
jgi:FdhD protein